MGSRIRPFLIAAPWLLAAPLSAQETEQPTGVFSLPPSRPAPDPNRQGPELDVYRDPVTPRGTPPATPPVVAPPVVPPSVTPPPVATRPVPAQPARPRPEAPRAQPPAERPAPTPAPLPEAAAPPDAADRPWVDMDLVVSQARYSLMGVTVAYSLILHNRGSRAAQDLLVRGIIGNAGAQQQALLQGFFGGQDGLPLHSVVTIAPGETLHLAGELRLAPDRIVPVEMGQRSLLIPIAAFDAAYRWQPDEGEKEGGGLAAGRTARAFIVGQEQEPPTARLAPLRLDQGPRQYRRPAARAAAELAPA